MAEGSCFTCGIVAGGGACRAIDGDCSRCGNFTGIVLDDIPFPPCLYGGCPGVSTDDWAEYLAAMDSLVCPTEAAACLADEACKSVHWL